jgi:hypothetical protein
MREKAKTLPTLIAWWAALLLLAFVAVPARAQFRTSIQGAVTDPQGAVIPGATLTLKNLATNETVVRKSDDVGIFNFNALPPDRFTLTVEREGFKTKVINDTGAWYNGGLQPKYLGGAGTSTSNKAFESGSVNYTNIDTGAVQGAHSCSNKYFSMRDHSAAEPTIASATSEIYESAGTQPAPGLARNSFNGPGYRDIDMSLA